MFEHQDLQRLREALKTARNIRDATAVIEREFGRELLPATISKIVSAANLKTVQIDGTKYPSSHAITLILEKDREQQLAIARKAQHKRTVENEKLKKAEDLVARTQEELAGKLQAVLDDLAGQEFANIADKRNVAKRIQRLLTQINRKIECLRCGEPANLRVVASAGDETGVFQFDHTHPKRSTHQGPVEFPRLTIVEAPQDQRYADE